MSSTLAQCYKVTAWHAGKMLCATLAVLGLLVACAGPATAQATAPKPAAPLAVTIDARQTATPTSKYEFGMFIEHIGPLIYRSLWSEMLDDRKFYFPITAPKPNVQGEQHHGGFPDIELRKWRPVAPGDAVTMDKESAVCRRSESAHFPR